MKLGVDFGSAYSTVSRYISGDDRAEALTLKEGDSSSIPSAVSISRTGEIMCGTSAKSKVGKKTVSVFEAFKMLLVETNGDIIAERGYSDRYTPRLAAKYFLESMITGVINRYGRDEEIEKLVVCVPDVWSTKVLTLDGRNILRNIFTNELELPGNKKIGHVQTVTEPEAASSFFAHNYETETGKLFNGYLLLIDYGGGTLDITLTKVESNGSGTMEISCCESGGIGENHPDQDGNYLIGNAGIAYMNKVVEIAVRDCEEIGEHPDYGSMSFCKAVHELEDSLKDPAKISEIEFNFGGLGSTYSDFENILDEEPITFCEIEYMDESVIVTYQHLFLAYRETVEGALRWQLDDVNSRTSAYIGADPCTIESGMRNDFKIAVVGGFGSYYLVRKQIAEIYNLDSSIKNDLRIKNINTDKCEQAISLGAALLASGRVILQKKAKFSIGLYSRSSDEKNNLYYGIRYRQEIKPDMPYFLLVDSEDDDIPSNRVKYGSLRGNITHFIVEFSDRTDKGFPMALKPEFLKRMENIPADGIWNLGFSMDENEVISFHIVPSAEFRTDTMREIVIPLDSYTNMFDLTSGEEVYADEA